MLGFHGDALGRYEIKQPVQPVGDRQNKSEQSRDAGQLRQPLPRSAELAAPRAENPGDGKGSESAHYLNYAGAAIPRPRANAQKEDK